MFPVGDVSRLLVTQVVTEVAKLKQQAILNQVCILRCKDILSKGRFVMNL